ncbi:MAG: HAD-IIB family hydrolase [Spirulinaceae cyanobacterium RM2_2_10]|nr:HAD-IIB family hydrolase [Spirulinaceae cyanobacterium SM2_1_0]NJO19018.1 HAD-IIB family hydrolase [Spirulinaceae cyanobacterium RM2_2_10]
MVANRDLTLATDLDGTFLGGSEWQRRDFYHYLQSRRDRLRLIFVTGRDLDFVQSLSQQADIPSPDYVIADVGTTVIDGRTWQPLTAVQAWIDHGWDHANERVRSLLAAEPGLRPQPIAAPRRVSYYYEPDRLQTATLDKIRAAGFDYILSAERYLDVLPAGVCKGTTLLKLLTAIDATGDRTITAGDTLNDLSLFATGLRGIAVGNAEPCLRRALRAYNNVYISPYPGTAGIWDGLRHFGCAIAATASP